MASKTRLRRKIFAFFGITFCCSVLAVSAIELGLFSRIESRLWDLSVQLTAEPDRAEKSIKLIVIDQASLDYFAEVEGYSWPWPRALYSYVLSFLERANAKAVAFDMLYTEDSFWGVDDDQQFAESIRGKLPVVMAAALLDDKRPVPDDRLEKFRSRRQAGSLERLLNNIPLNEYQSILLPIPELLDRPLLLGNVRAITDEDGVFRHTVPAAKIDGATLLSLPFALYRAVHPKELFELEKFVDKQGRLTLRFHGPEQTYRHYSIADIIKSEQWLAEAKGRLTVDPEEFRDALVLLSVGAPGLFDSHPTPLSSALLGVEYNANILDNLLHRNFVIKAGVLGRTAHAIILTALAVAVVLFFSRLRYQFIALFILFAGAVSFSAAAAYYGYWFPSFVPLLGMGISILGALSFQYYFEGRDHRFLKGAFAQYVNQEVIAELIANPEKLSLGGERRELSIFFSDIADFTSISEQLAPGALVQLLNEYLSLLTDIILASGGTLDKYNGDAIMCFWNAPLDIEDHALRAVKAAVQCQNALEELRPELEKKYGVTLRTRFGIHTGPATVGNFGSAKRFDYTVIGDAANLASRLEGANKTFGTTILISDQTRTGLPPNYTVRKVGRLQAIGRGEPVIVWEVLAEEKLSAELLEKFEQARLAFEMGHLAEARKIFSTLSPYDELSRRYLRRLERELLGKDRPPAEWSPIWQQDTK